MAARSSDIILLSGNSHPELVIQIARRLGVHVANSSVVQASNTESLIHIGQSLRGKDVYIIQTGTKDVNNNIMNLLIMAYTCKTSSARKVVGVIPYLPYSKQSKMLKRNCIVSKLLARMMEKAGFTQIITMDLHQKEVQGFFDIPVDNLQALHFLIQYIREQIPDYQNAVIVAKDANSVSKATSFAKRLNLNIAVIYVGGQKDAEVDTVDGRYSPPAVKTSVMGGGLDRLLKGSKEKHPINVVGDVEGRDAILVANLIDDAEPFVAAADVLKKRGARKIYLLATHGLFSSDSPRLFENSSINEVVVTNTIPHELEKQQCNKIKTVDVSTLISEAIRRIHNKESNFLFVPQYYFGR